MESTDFTNIKETFDAWVKEFLESEQATSLTDFQKDNIEDMAYQLLSLSQSENIDFNTWTGEIVVELTRKLYGSLDRMTEFFQAYPATMATFLQFLGEKNYLPTGKEIGQRLIAASAELDQLETEQAKLAWLNKTLEKATAEGIDLENEAAAEAFMRNELLLLKAMNKLHDKLEKGYSAEAALGSLSMKEQELVLKDNAKHLLATYDLVKASKALTILEEAEAKGMSRKEAIASVPKELMPDLLGVVRSMQQMDTSAYLPPSEPVQTIRRAPKIGRNDACSCGSGKKYKRCCLRKR